MPKPLSNIRVLDFSMGVAGPHIAHLCALYGADVVKFESFEGDWARRLGKVYGDFSAYSAVYNRGKRSIAIDLKTDEGQAIAKSLLPTADVVIESFRPGVMKKFGLDFDSVRRIKPDIVYASVSGFGQKGSRSNLPATDGIAQGFSGFISINKDRAGQPFKINMIVMDVITGLFGFNAVAMQLMAKQSGSAVGAHIDCSLLQSAIAFQAPKIAEHYLEGGKAALYVPLGVFPTKDGSLNISVNQNPDFESFCRALDRRDLVEDKRFGTRDLRVENAEELLAIVEMEMRKHPTADLIRRFTREDVKHSPVWTYEDLLADKEIERLGWIGQASQRDIQGGFPLAQYPGSVQIASDAPAIGQHTDDILSELGFSAEKISGLRKAMVVK